MNTLMKPAHISRAPTSFIPLLALVLVLAQSVAAAEQFTSGPGRAHLVELFTSEGCSSCPPADRWLATFVDSPRLWREIVPVAYHVSYWDRLGWADRFAQREFDVRQRRLAESSGAAVYTPGVFRDGREWRGWRGAGNAQDPGTDPVGTLTLRRSSRDTWMITFEAVAGSPDGPVSTLR